jgi:undecaprenyl-phosphate 4-deoxy-4-formamido-L-arabinose transferase
MAEHYSVVIPVFNGANTLPDLVERLTQVLPNLCDEYEIILINDGSHDQSWETIVQSIDQHPSIVGINLMRNYGQHNALLCGITAAQNDIIITMDDDLQHPPEQIPLLVAKLAEGYDVVYGTPIQRQHGLWRNAASWLMKLLLQRAMGAQTAESISAFRAFRAQVRQAFMNYRSPYVNIDVLLTWGTTRFTAIPTHHAPRELSTSNYTFSKLLVHTINMITGFSIWPLQMASIIGLLSTLFGLVVLAYVIGRYLLQGSSVPGFPFLASVITIFSGTQLFILGVLGEYLARMHFRMMDRPIYTVRETRVNPEHKPTVEQIDPMQGRYR